MNCPSDTLWRDYLLDTAEFCVKAYGCDGIYLDQLLSLIHILLLRAAGMFFRIYIAARIGAEGMGLYQLIYLSLIHIWS